MIIKPFDALFYILSNPNTYEKVKNCKPHDTQFYHCQEFIHMLMDIIGQTCASWLNDISYNIEYMRRIEQEHVRDFCRFNFNGIKIFGYGLLNGTITNLHDFHYSMYF